MTVLVDATLELSDSGCRIGGDWYQWGEVVSLDPATRSLSHLTGGKGDYANAPLRSENLKGDARRRFGDWLSQVRLHFAFGSDTSPNWKVTKRDLAARIFGEPDRFRFTVGSDPVALSSYVRNWRACGRRCGLTIMRVGEANGSEFYELRDFDIRLESAPSQLASGDVGEIFPLPPPGSICYRLRVETGGPDWIEYAKGMAHTGLDDDSRVTVQIPSEQAAPLPDAANLGVMAGTFSSHLCTVCSAARKALQDLEVSVLCVEGYLYPDGTGEVVDIDMSWDWLFGTGPGQPLEPLV